MKKTFLLIFFLTFAQSIWTQRTIEPLSQEEQRLSEELKKDQEYVQISLGRRQASRSTDIDTSYRLKALEAFNIGNEKLKLKKSRGTKEGDPIFSYLTVEKGKAQVFIDTLQDDFGPKRVYFYNCGELDIGIYFFDLKAGKMVFRKAGTDEIDEIKDGQVALRCIAGEKEIIF